jgi:hypothetical protein
MKVAPAILLLIVPALIACSCGWNGPFLKMASSDGAIVVVGTVREHLRTPENDERGTTTSEPGLMILRVEECLQGSVTEEEIPVFGDSGFLCRPYVSRFPQGTRWAFVLFPCEGGFAISICGEFWLEEVDGKFRGCISNNNRKRIQKVTLDELREKIRANKPVEASRLRPPRSGGVFAGPKKGSARKRGQTLMSDISGPDVTGSRRSRTARRARKFQVSRNKF